MTARSKGVTVLAIVVAMIFFFTGGMKLAGKMTEQFVAWGYPGWFAYLTGGIEVVSAELLLNPRARFAASALLVFTMIGAVATHYLHGEIMQSLPATVTLALVIQVAWATLPSRPENQQPG